MKILELLERIAVALEARVASRTEINELRGFVVKEMAEQWLAMVAYSDAGNSTDIREHINEYHTAIITSEETDTPWHFDPKSGEFPAELKGMKVGYVIMQRNAPLFVVGKDNVLEEYENPEWAANTTGRRIIAKSGRILMVYSPPDSKENVLYIRDGKPFPFVFDGVGTRAWQVMGEQDVDGEALDGFTHEPLFVKATDAIVWEPPTPQEAV